MWKKEEMLEYSSAPEQEKPFRADTPIPAPAPIERATIGRSITVRGDVTGDEDLVIQGRVEGSIELEQHSVTIGADGVVNASIVGRVVTIEGHVQGNITAEEQAVLRSSAFVQGDITAPRVVLENGAQFRGGVDMGDADERANRTIAPISGRSKKTGDTKLPPEPAVLSAAGEAALIGNGGSPTIDLAEKRA